MAVIGEGDSPASFKGPFASSPTSKRWEGEVHGGKRRGSSGQDERDVGPVRGPQPGAGASPPGRREVGVPVRRAGGVRPGRRRILGFPDFLRDVIKSFQSPPTSGSSEGTNGGYSRGLARLPPIALPKFSGEYTEWPSFRDLFTSLVIGNATLSFTTRLQYLHSAVGVRRP